MIIKAEIIAGLKELGLREGDIVLLHSSLSSLGQVEGGAETVMEAFLDCLGESGTLVVPVFEPGLGRVTEVFARHPRAVQSIHPLACVAAIGKDAGDICRDHWRAETAHCEGTPYQRLAEKGGYVCLLGVDQDRNTTLHTVETLLRLPYLTTETRTFQTPEGEVTKSWPFFPGPHRDFIGLDPLLRASGKMKMGQIGSAVVRLIKSRDLIEIALEAGRKDPGFVLCDNPSCPDCIAQRARLRRDIFGGETFRVASSAALAGEFAEEIAVRCLESGIGAVELDALRGRPIGMLGPAVVERAVGRLREEGLEVVALRSAAVPGRFADLLALARDQRIERVIMPMSHHAPEQAAAASRVGISISFCNANLDSDACSQLLLEMRGGGLACGFTFDGAEFARCGELPFLGSYKKKLRRFVDQLDLVDGGYDGRPRPLAGGNAEVKEIISILRCAGFRGWMVLGARNRQTGTLEEAAARLERLLARM